MKKLLLIIISLLLFSCKSREKQVQKSETQSEKKSEASYKIEDRTFEIVFDKSVLNKNFSYKNQISETSKKEIKNTEKGKEYWENGNLKKEWEKDLSELSEITKSVIEEITDKLTKETEDKKYWEKSSNHYYQLLEEEKSKTKDYAMQLKAKETFAWQMFFVGLILGWLLLPSLFSWIFSWVKKFQPYIALVEWIKNLNIKKL